MNPKISIIVPVYNTEKYIKRTIISILNQTYKNIEIIIVDDGSTDGSWDEINRISSLDDRIIIIHQNNKGVTSARLNGVKNSTGEWIGFIDSDDEAESVMYETLIKNALEYNADISHCGYKLILPSKTNYFYNTKQIIEQTNKTGLTDLLQGKFIEPGLCNKLYKRTLFDKLVNDNLMDLNIKINEDLLMNFYLFKESKHSVFIDECFYKYNYRSNSASRDKINENRIYDPIKVKQIILDSVSSDLKNVALKVYLSTCVNVYNTLTVTPKVEKRHKQNVRKHLIEHRASFSLLNKKTKLLALLITYFPFIYKPIYIFYSKFLQVKKYD